MINDGRFVCKDVTLYVVCMRDDIWIQKGHCAVNEEKTGHTNTETLRYIPAEHVTVRHNTRGEKYCRFILLSLEVFPVLCSCHNIHFLALSLSLFSLLPMSLIDSIIDSVMHRDVLHGIHTRLYTYLR